MIYTISSNLKKLRISKNLTQQQLCEELKEKGYHVLRNTYTKYESGKRTIPYEFLAALAVYYEVSTDYILGLKK